MKTKTGARFGFVMSTSVILLFVMPIVPSAQPPGCVYDAWAYADLYDPGIGPVELFGDAADFSECPQCPHDNYWLYLGLSGPNGSAYNYFDYAPATLPLSVTTSGWVSYDVNFTFDCLCAGPLEVPFSGAQEVQRPPLRNLSITLNAFLPDEWVDVPIPPTGRIWEGDNRSYSEFGSRRITLRPEIRDPVNDPNSPALIVPVYRDAFLSVEYDKATSLDSNGHITNAARADWVWGGDLKTQWGQAQLDSNDYCTGYRTGSQVRLYCAMSIAHGIYPAWLQPDIEWAYDMTFTYSGTTSTSVQYEIVGCHTYFPAFEIYADGQVIHQDWRGGIWSVNWPCSTAEPVNLSGTVIAQP